jgi:NAD(P)-dependent dehydrogenase (short-subunit alcohol dehydrogenase family)
MAGNTNRCPDIAKLDPRLENRVAFVTGAGQGIGQATAFRLAVEGAAVGVMDRNAETATFTADTIKERGGEAIAIECDVTDAAAVERCVQILLDRFGRIDVLVNNAGFDRPGGFLKMTPEDFQAVWGVHFLGAVNCCQACGPLMIEQSSGSIVNVSSIYAKAGSKGESAYCSVKAGLIGLTKSLAREWGPKGVRVNAILPGLTDTPTIRDVMSSKFKDAIIAETPLGRIADPSEIASAIAFLASDDASFITGATLEVTGGWNL